jgi:hypothetical protein
MFTWISTRASKLTSRNSDKTKRDPEPSKPDYGSAAVDDKDQDRPSDSYSTSSSESHRLYIQRSRPHSPVSSHREFHQHLSAVSTSQTLITPPPRPPVTPQLLEDPDFPPPLRKPVIYVFSPSEIDVSITLTLPPTLHFSALFPTPAIKHISGAEQVNWTVRTLKDGTLVDHDTGLEISYLFWEAEYVYIPIFPPPQFLSELTERRETLHYPPLTPQSSTSHPRSKRLIHYSLLSTTQIQSYYPSAKSLPTLIKP